MAAELVIGGVITSDPWMDGDVSSASVRTWLEKHAKEKDILVRLNSPGGDAFEGVATFNALKRHGARVMVEVEGLAASAASVIAMAGDTIAVHSGAQIMIHEASSIEWGNAKDLRKTADRLDKIGIEVAQIYATRTGQSVERVLELMAEETWMGGKDAVQLGFADKVIPAKAKPQQSARAQALMSTYKRAPRSLFEQTQARQQMTAVRSPLGELARGHKARIGDR